MHHLLLCKLMQVSPLFITMLFARQQLANTTKWFPSSKFWSKSLNFDLSVMKRLVAPQSTKKLVLSQIISYPKAKK